jgi:hypothetical protein
MAGQQAVGRLHVQSQSSTTVSQPPVWRPAVARLAGHCLTPATCATRAGGVYEPGFG